MLKDLEKRIFAFKVKKGFNTKADYNGLNEEICHLVEELGELAYSHRRGDKKGVTDAVIDILIYTLGLFAIFKIDGDKEVEKVLKKIEKREYKRNKDGTSKRIKE